MERARNTAKKHQAGGHEGALNLIPKAHRDIYSLSLSLALSLSLSLSLFFFLFLSFSARQGAWHILEHPCQATAEFSQKQLDGKLTVGWKPEQQKKSHNRSVI